MYARYGGFHTAQHSLAHGFCGSQGPSGPPTPPPPGHPRPSPVRFGAFLVPPIGPQTRHPNGGHSGVRCGARKGIVNTAQPMAPVVPWDIRHGRKGCWRGPGNRRGHGLSCIDDVFFCAAWEPTITRMHTTVATLQLSRPCSPNNHTARQDRPLGSYWRPPCAPAWFLKAPASHAPPTCMRGQATSNCATFQNQDSRFTIAVHFNIWLETAVPVLPFLVTIQKFFPGPIRPLLLISNGQYSFTRVTSGGRHG